MKRGYDSDDNYSDNDADRKRKKEEESEDLLQRRREINRRSARKNRAKQMIMMNELQEELQSLQHENRKLSQENVSLKSQEKILEDILQNVTATTPTPSSSHNTLRQLLSDPLLSASTSVSQQQAQQQQQVQGLTSYNLESSLQQHVLFGDQLRMQSSQAVAAMPNQAISRLLRVDTNPTDLQYPPERANSDNDPAREGDLKLDHAEYYGKTDSTSTEQERDEEK